MTISKYLSSDSNTLRPVEKDLFNNIRGGCNCYCTYVMTTATWDWTSGSGTIICASSGKVGDIKDVGILWIGCYSNSTLCTIGCSQTAG